jgi:hypothetical protein
MERRRCWFRHSGSDRPRSEGSCMMKEGQGAAGSRKYEWLTPKKITGQRATKHSHQIRTAQEKRISEAAHKEMGSLAAPPQREKEQGEPPTEEPIVHDPKRHTPPQLQQREQVQGTTGTSASQRELFPSICSPQREPPLVIPPSQLQAELAPAAASPSRGSRCQTSAPVCYPQREPGFMQHFNMLHATAPAISTAPYAFFKETNHPHQAAAVHLAAMLSDDRTTSPLQSPSSQDKEAGQTTAVFSAKKKNNDPDSSMYHEARANVDKKLWLEGMVVEVKQLESINCWDVIPRSQATKHLTPSTWVCRCKRYPDGRVKKCKSRFSVRGDLEGDMDPWETYAPVISSSMVQLVLIMCMVFGLTTWCMDFTNAFVHAELAKEEQFFIELPKGSTAADGSDSVLRLKRALYGSRRSPQLFFHVLRDSYLQQGFTQSKLDPPMPVLQTRHDDTLILRQSNCVLPKQGKGPTADEGAKCRIYSDR